jgi:peroxiredoxin (alkyl hydroperoxide reductase subunit C)
MSEDGVKGCVSAAEGPISTATGEGGEESSAKTEERKERKMQVSVGKEAPDFGANAFHEGGFKSIKLSEFRGKWVFLCFYPGDFTFV